MHISAYAKKYTKLKNKQVKILSSKQIIQIVMCIITSNNHNK